MPRAPILSETERQQVRHLHGERFSLLEEIRDLEDKIQQLRCRANALTVPALAVKFECSKGTINDILYGVRGKHR